MLRSWCLWMQLPRHASDSETGSEMWYNTSLHAFLATVQSGPSNVTSQLSINGGAAQPTQLSFETEPRWGVPLWCTS